MRNGWGSLVGRYKKVKGEQDHGPSRVWVMYFNVFFGLGLGYLINIINRILEFCCNRFYIINDGFSKHIVLSLIKKPYTVKIFFKIRFETK